MDLLKKLGIIVVVFSTFLIIRTLVAPPNIKVGITADNLKAYLCETNWWDRWFSFMEAIFLAWGVRLCLSVRKAPSQFNESRYISFTIYNEFCMSTIFSLLMVYFHIPANPDIEYVISFAHTQITITVLLCFIFGSKASRKESWPLYEDVNSKPGEVVLHKCSMTAYQNLVRNTAIQGIKNSIFILANSKTGLIHKAYQFTVQ